MKRCDTEDRSSSIRLLDTASKRQQPFQPLGDVATMYVCGMTPKDKPHIGHARLFVHADVCRRYLEYRGFKVNHVQNFTDIDDKIIERATAAGRDPMELSRENSLAYFDVMDKLNVLHAHLFPKVTDNIAAIIASIEELIVKGHAYETSTGVYFEVKSWGEYGKLSGRTEADAMAGARVEVDPEKRDPRDFALWKLQKEGEVYWESPWGRGRPGWHIECSSMIRRHLGPQIDIHWGGSDLIFPHHENELAQAEAGFGVGPFVGVWMHLAVLRINGEKMGHSMGNFVTVETLFEEFDPQIVRLYLVSTKYRSPVDFSRESLPQAAAGCESLWAVLRARPADPGEDDASSAAALQDATTEARARFERALDDDLNTAAALATLYDFGKVINRLASQSTAANLSVATQHFKNLAGVLGLEPASRATDNGDVEPLIQLLIDVRSELRDQNVWDVSDRIRNELAELGVTLEDGPSSTTWRRN